jgi:AcrR family transcriptional regulator
MTRPSRKTDRLLIDAARKLVPDTGLSGLKLRDVARAAGVNLGMFHYHFKTKAAFTRRVLEDIYEEFFASLRLEAEGPGSPVERLARALRVFGRFSRDNRKDFLFLLSEVMRGEPEASALAGANMPRHTAVIAGLLKEAFDAGDLRRVPLPIALTFALGTLGSPNAVVAMIERAGARRPFGRPVGEFRDAMLSEEAVDLRVELVLTALAPRRARRHP